MKSAIAGLIMTIRKNKLENFELRQFLADFVVSYGVGFFAKY